MQANPIKDRKTKYIPQIDSLRAIAVIAVMIYHLNISILPGGFSGVDVFFVISGYVVSVSLNHDSQKSFVCFLLDFYTRRIVRIIPALLVCLVIVGLFTTLLVPNSWLSNTNQITALYAFFGLSNIALIWSSDGYFSPRIDFNPFAHTWSLAVEEQFYLIFPVIFFIWARLRCKKGILRLLGNWLLSSILIFSFIYSWRITDLNPDMAFYLLPSRFWEMACGALLFQLQRENKLSLNSVSSSSWLIVVGLSMILAGFLFSQKQHFPFPWALFAVSGSMLLITGVSSPYHPLFLDKLLLNRWLIFIGKLSYSLYLWHWPVYVLFRWTVGLDSLLYAVLAVVLTSILSILSFYLLENQIRGNSFILRQPKWHIVVSGVVCIIICWKLTSSIFARQPLISLSVTRDINSWYSYPNPGIEKDHCKTNINSIQTNGINVTSFQRDLCDHTPRSSSHIFVIGDSHAGAYNTLLYKLAVEEGIKVFIYSQAGCGLANLHVSSVALGTKCTQLLQATMVNIKQQIKPGDVIFLAALRMDRLSEQDGSNLLGESEAIAKQNSDYSRKERYKALHEADKVLEFFDQTDLHVIIEAPKPIFKSPAFRCSDWFNSKNPVCVAGLSVNREFLLNYRQPIMDSLKVLSAKYSRLIVWDPFPILCPNDLCLAVDHRGPLFFDGDHLSGKGNLVLYPSFLSLLKQTRVLDTAFEPKQLLQTHN